MFPTKRPAEDEAERPAAEAGSSRPSAKKARLTSASVNASRDARPDPSNTVASSSSAKKENSKPPTKGKGKGKAHATTIEEAVETATQTVRIDAIVHTDTLLTPAERKHYNDQRRSARHEEASKDDNKADEQRFESGLKHSPVIAEYLVEAFRHAAEVEEALQAVPDVEGDLVFVQSVVAKFCEVNRHTPLPPTAEVWAHIPPPAVRLLAALARAPTNLDVSPFIADGTLVLSSCDDAPPVSEYHYYLRLVETAEKTKAALLSYLLAYPANAANTLLQLLLQGEDIAFVHNKFRESMEPHGLEGAVDIFVNTIRSDANISCLASTRLQTASTCLPYVGLTNTVACAQRAADDISQGAPVGFVNFLSSTPTLAYAIYYIPSLNAPTTMSFDLRTNPVIGDKERILRAVLGGSALNSAPGGVKPIFAPTEEMTAILDRLTALLPPLESLLGQERDEALEQRITTLIDDEVQLLAPCHSTKITPAAIQSVKSQVASVLRLKRGRVIRLNMGKDIPLEGTLGKGGYWDAAVGPGPQEDRHLRRLLDVAIPSTGNLSEDIIAKWIGPFINFWRCTLSHLLYLLHILLLARLLADLRPLLIFAQSNPLSAALRSGDLVLSSSSLPEDLWRQFFEDGFSSPQLVDIFPPDVRYRFTRGSTFNEQLGHITLIPTGLNPALLALLVSVADCGRLKYDPALARYRWVVDFLVGLVARAVTYLISARLDSHPVPDWNDAAATKAWLLAIKADAEKVLESTGVTAALEVAKSRARRAELAVTFLRTVMSSLQGGTTRNYKRRTGLQALAGAEERAAQLDAILTHAHLLDSLDLPPDPDHLAPYAHPILSDTFSSWFMGLKDGTDIVYAANALGRSDEAMKVIQLRTAKFVESNRRTELSMLQTARNGMIGAMRKLISPCSYEVSDIQYCYRLVHCLHCEWSGLGLHNGSVHECSVRGTLTISESNFPDLERVLYVHDVLHDPASLILGDLAPVLADLKLVRVPVNSILRSRRVELESVLGKKHADAILSAPECDLEVFVGEDDCGNQELLLNLAVDVILRRYSRCPPVFLPVHPGYREGWSKKTAQELQCWLRGETNPVYLAVCPGPQNCEKPPHTFLSIKIIPRMKTSLSSGSGEPDNTTHTITGGRECNNCFVDGKKDRKCAGRRFFKAETILDLPPHHSRQIWYQLRFGTHWAKARSRKKKAKD